MFNKISEAVYNKINRILTEWRNMVGWKTVGWLSELANLGIYIPYCLATVKQLQHFFVVVVSHFLRRKKKNCKNIISSKLVEFNILQLSFQTEHLLCCVYRTVNVSHLYQTFPTKTENSKSWNIVMLMIFTRNTCSYPQL